MRDNLAQPRGPEGSPVDAIEMVDRLLIIAGRRLRVRLPVASSVRTMSGLPTGNSATRLLDTARLQIKELAISAVQAATALHQMIEFCLTTAPFSGLPRSAGI